MVRRSAGRYVRSNLNMPSSLPLWGDKRDYDMDAPITVVGSTQARLVGAFSGGYRVTS